MATTGDALVVRRNGEAIDQALARTILDRNPCAQPACQGSYECLVEVHPECLPTVAEDVSGCGLACRSCLETGNFKRRGRKYQEEKGNKSMACARKKKVESRYDARRHSRLLQMHRSPSGIADEPQRKHGCEGKSQCVRELVKTGEADDPRFIVGGLGFSPHWRIPLRGCALLLSSPILPITFLLSFSSLWLCRRPRIHTDPLGM